MNPSQVDIPPLKDLTADNITENVHLINSRCPDPRTKYLFERLVVQLHDFARETRLSTGEWTAAIKFLTATGQICSDVRQEFILLSDILGLSLLVDSINHPKPKDATDGTLLGPFHTHDAKPLNIGDTISHDPNGESMLVLCSIKDRQGRPVADVKVDMWETDSGGKYDVQHAGRTEPDGRAVLRSNKEGKFWFKAIVPVSYPIPHDGPVGKLLMALGRHPWRPAHLHFMFEKEGFDHLITALYLRGDPYESSDAVFGVKTSLLVDLADITPEQAQKYNMQDSKAKVLVHDFVLLTQLEAMEMRNRNLLQALKQAGQAGRRMKLLHGLPVPDVD